MTRQAKTCSENLLPKVDSLLSARPFRLRRLLIEVETTVGIWGKSFYAQYLSTNQEQKVTLQTLATGFSVVVGSSRSCSINISIVWTSLMTLK